MKCPACAQALTGDQGQFYRAACNGCASRAVAKSDAMATLMQARKNMQDMLRRTMPGVQHDQAWREVMAWWRIEEQAQKGGASG